MYRSIAYDLGIVEDCQALEATGITDGNDLGEPNVERIPAVVESIAGFIRNGYDYRAFIVSLVKLGGMMYQSDIDNISSSLYHMIQDKLIQPSIIEEEFNIAIPMSSLYSGSFAGRTNKMALAGNPADLVKVTADFMAGMMDHPE